MEAPKKRNSNGIAENEPPTQIEGLRQELENFQYELMQGEIFSPLGDL